MSHGRSHFVMSLSHLMTQRDLHRPPRRAGGGGGFTRQNMYISIRLCLLDREGRLHNMCVSVSAVSETCGLASTGLAQSAFLPLFLPYLPLSSTLEVLSLGRRRRGPEEQKHCSFPPLLLSSFPPTSHAPAPR